MLRLLFLSLLAALCVVPAAASLDDEYGAALNKARTAGKPVILFFNSKNCPYCELMENETFSDRQTLSAIAETAVLVKVDGEGRRDLARLYLIRGYPTTWLIDERGSRIGQIPGYISRKDFQSVISYLKGKYYRSMGITEYLSRKK
jgi:thioredoxin-related protein